PDGLFLCAGGDDHQVRLWDRHTGVERVLSGHEGAVRALAFSANRQLLASGGDDQSVRLWDVATAQERGALAGQEGEVSALAFSPDSTLLVGGSRASTGGAVLW